MGLAWTDERTDVCVKMWGDGHSASEIAMKLGGVSRNAVIGKVYRLGLIRDEAAVHRFRHGQRPKKVKTEQRTRPTRVAKPRAPKAHNNLVAHNAAQRQRSKPGKDYVKVAPIVVDATLAKPWLERRFGECAYPISGEGADTFSCCQPTEATYCKGHAAAMFWRPTETAKRFERMARRYA